MGRFSGMEISSSPGLKIPQKLAHGRNTFPSKESISILRSAQRVKLEFKE